MEYSERVAQPHLISLHLHLVAHAEDHEVIEGGEEGRCILLAGNVQRVLAPLVEYQHMIHLTT